MCPKTLILYVQVSAVAAGVILFYRARFAAMRDNFKRLSPLLLAPQERSALIRSTLEGYYKNRKVVFSCAHLDEGDNVVLSMEPGMIPNPQPGFSLTYPRPTVNTRWKGKRVVYSFRRFTRYSSEEFRDVLEELTEAAQKVENGIDLKAVGKGL